MGREYVYILDVANHEMEEGEEYTYDEYAIASEWIDKKLGLWRMLQLKIRIETDEWIYEEYLEAWRWST